MKNREELLALAKKLRPWSDQSHGISTPLTDDLRELCDGLIAALTEPEPLKIDAGYDTRVLK